MKARILICVMAAASLGLGSVSFAQGYDRDRRDNDRQGYEQRGGGARPGYPQSERRRDDERGWRGDGRRERDERMGYNRDFRNDNFHYGARGPEWRRGGHIPQLYRSRQYVVNDWRAHHLSPPPRGYQWVQVGPDYVLVAVATGIIAQLILSQ